MEIKINGKAEVVNPTSFLLEQIKRETKVKNPAYEKVKMYGRGFLPKEYLYFYKYSFAKKTLTFPRGLLNKLVPEAEYQPFGNFKQVEPKKEKFALRSIQKEAQEAYLEHIGDKEWGQGYIVLLTGGGKSILGLSIANKMKQKTLIIVHKTDLLHSWKKDCKDFLGYDIGIIQGKKMDIRDITVGTIQTVSKHLKELKDEFGMLIIDESQHAPSKTFYSTEALNANYRLGLSATMMRNDGLTPLFDFYFEKCVYKSDVAEGILDASKLSYRTIPLKLGFTPIQEGSKSLIWSNINAYEDECLEYLMEHPKIYSSKSLVTFKRVESCEALYKNLRKKGIKAELLVGSTKDKAEIIERMKNSDSQVLIATSVLVTEGTNIPNLNQLILCSDPQNKKDVIQIVGRVRRECKGKTTAEIIDFKSDNNPILAKHYLKRYLILEGMGIFNVDNKLKRN